MRRQSARREAEREDRARCREEVLRRDRRCRCNGRTPIRCAGEVADVHELGRGQWRRFCYLDPDCCIGLSRECHRWVTEHPREAIDLGLAWDSGTAERRLRELGRLR